jgi:hypothetical protein
MCGMIARSLQTKRNSESHLHAQNSTGFKFLAHYLKPAWDSIQDYLPGHLWQGRWRADAYPRECQSDEENSRVT